MVISNIGISNDWKKKWFISQSASPLIPERLWNKSSWMPFMGTGKTRGWLETASIAKISLTNLIAFYDDWLCGQRDSSGWYLPWLQQGFQCGLLKSNQWDIVWLGGQKIFVTLVRLLGSKHCDRSSPSGWLLVIIFRDQFDTEGNII